MRKLMLLAALALMVPAAANAQDRPRQMGGRGQMMNTVEWLVTNREEFKASDDQIAKLEAIAKKFDSDTEKQRTELDKAREAMRSGTSDRAAVMAQLRPIREDMQKKDEAALVEALKVLSEDQQKTVKALIEARREEMQSRRRPAGQPIR
jgi:Spy/CpxP family protein refolding chaperone